jgi:hypothetical protein
MVEPLEKGHKPESDESSSSESDKPSIQDAIRKVSEHKPEAISDFIALGMGHMTNPLHQKMNAEHISTVLELATKHDEREYNLALGQQRIGASSRWFQLAVFVVSCFVIVFLIWMFKDKPDVLVPLITAILAFGGGFGSGFGYARKTED